MSKRKLADELADLINPLPKTEIDPETFAINEDVTNANHEDEQLAAFDLDASNSKRQRKDEHARTRMRADIEVGGHEYRGKRSSRAAIFGPGEVEEEMEEVEEGEDEEGEMEEEVEREGDENNEETEIEEEEEEDGIEDDEGEEGEEEDDPNEGDEEDDAMVQRRAGRAASSRELAQLEAEYGQLEQQEEEAVKAMKQRGDKERVKGLAVQSQQVLYERSLEMRILLQKSLQASHRLPLPHLMSRLVTDKKSLGAEKGSVSSNGTMSDTSSELESMNSRLQALRQTAKSTLGQLLALQAALLCRHETVSSTLKPGERGQPLEQEVGGTSMSSDMCWNQLDMLFKVSCAFRDSALDKWHRRTVMMGSGALKGGPSSQLKALNQSISSQVAAAMKDQTKVIQRSRLPVDSCPRPLGESSEASLIKWHPEGSQEDGVKGAQNAKHQKLSGSADKQEIGADVWVQQSYDDGEFYHQLLREFMAKSSATGIVGGANTKKRRKVVDRRASKGRKIRYHVHEKMVNFMASAATEPPAFAAQLFANLFGSKGNTSN
ncbi:hypothetical protein CEUSTIGMA_g6637.t1 [Chlamydomonas eustigma]|uniref:Apoptosis-antagonizing transcription factor C-terminal domain-containing protein n=1 Tax=Chlamydomonas eustigma TaxID=1157962 RepID=A0A250X812_9CHLO|nr:hypothetical protein CEUSTIGMA_g6637.t1 [Chlamydomonas eustigma]|eukprot:GAX79197.1 hypothetical protein CEUSTIGMA_g6637.t1 [Chlamydomonas eustigma]